MKVNSKKKSGLLTSWSEAIASRNISVAANLLLSIAILILAGALFLKAPHTIAITQDNIFGDFEVKGDRANQNFQQSWAFAIANLLGNIDQSNVKFVKTAILNVLSPRLKVTMEPLLERQVELINQRGVKQIFIADDLIHEPETDLIAVWGKKITFIENKIRDTERWTYEFKILAKNGKPKVVYLNQYKGTPRKKKASSNGKGKQKSVIVDDYYDKELEINHLKAAQALKENGDG